MLQIECERVLFIVSDLNEYLVKTDKLLCIAKEIVVADYYIHLRKIEVPSKLYFSVKMNFILE